MMKMKKTKTMKITKKHSHLIQETLYYKIIRITMKLILVFLTLIPEKNQPQSFKQLQQAVILFPMNIGKIRKSFGSQLMQYHSISVVLTKFRLNPRRHRRTIQLLRIFRIKIRRNYLRQQMTRKIKLIALKRLTRNLKKNFSLFQLEKIRSCLFE